MRRILFLIVPLVFTFVSCGDQTVTRNTSYQTLYATVSGAFQTMNTVAMNASKYGISCFNVDSNTELVSEALITTRPRDNSTASAGVTIWIERAVLEVKPINGTPGTSQSLLFNGGLPIGPIRVRDSFPSKLTVPATIFPVPTDIDEQGNLIHNQYEIWATVYIQERRGEILTCPEGWFQMFWGLLYTAPAAADGGKGACVGILGGS